MAWVKQVLRGAEFTMEAINMMCFMMEEAAQSALMGYGMALQNLDMDLAEEIRNGTMQECHDYLFEYWALYCLPMMPNAGAWQSFYHALHMSMINSDIRFENYKRLLALGIDPRPGKNKTKP